MENATEPYILNYSSLLVQLVQQYAGEKLMEPQLIVLGQVCHAGFHKVRSDY